MFKKFSQKFINEKDVVGKSVLFIHECLVALKVDRRQRVRSELLCEESISQLVAHAKEDGELFVSVKETFGKIHIHLQMPGEEFAILSDTALGEIDAENENALEVIQAFVFKAYGENFKTSYKKNMNMVRIAVDEPSQTILRTAIALLAGVLFGLFMRYGLPQNVVGVISEYALTPIKTVFMNALNMVVAPVVFFSIVTCFSQYNGISEFGKIGAKVMMYYLLTTFMAVIVSMSFSILIQPGQLGFALSSANIGQIAIAESTTDTSILNMLINIVPNNFLSPFLESNTLQLIFLAALCGSVFGAIGDYAKTLKDLFEALNSMFLQITTLIASFIPLTVFCSVSLLVYSLDLASLQSIIGVIGVELLSIASMLCIYACLIFFFGHLNPFTFFKKAKEGMLMGLTLSSSSAAMPTNLKICTQKLGISPRLANFSIPLGASVNMDGASIFLTVMTLFLARAYGIEVTQSQLLSLAITNILLSLGAPGVPGAGMVCLGIALKTVNVPIEAIGLIIAIYPFLDMVNTMNNVTGDMTVSTIVANSENILDRDIYNKI